MISSPFVVGLTYLKSCPKGTDGGFRLAARSFASWSSSFRQVGRLILGADQTLYRVGIEIVATHCGSWMTVPPSGRIWNTDSRPANST